MSRTPKRKDREEGDVSILRDSVGRVTFLDPFGDPAFLPPADVNENTEGLIIRLELPGVRLNNFLRLALKARLGREVTPIESWRKIQAKMKELEMDEYFAARYLNEGFSGGEKKRNEVMQMAILEPELAILDETDSGLDIDALRIVAKGIREIRADRPSMGVVLITHYQRLLDELQPSHVHIMVHGRIVASGGMELAAQLERDGYEAFR